MSRRSAAACALIAAAALVVASAVAAQDVGSGPPAAAAPNEGAVDAGASAGEPEVAPGPDAGEPTSDAPVTADGTAGAETTPEAGEASSDPGRGEARRVVSRRREAALVGGWVASVHDPASFTVTVDDLVLGANGEWTRRVSRVGSDRGLLAPPEESSGTWFTEESTVVLLDRGSAVDEVLRSPFLIDDRSELLTLESEGGPVVYYRYR